MIIKFTDSFRKQYKKVDVRIQRKFEKRLALFIKNPQDLQLKNHLLKGKYLGFYSINITGDFRALYTEEMYRDGKGVIKETVIYFSALGTHSQLYR